MDDLEFLQKSLLIGEHSGKRSSKKASFDPSKLEYHEVFLDWLTGEHARGRTLILAMLQIDCNTSCGYVFILRRNGIGCNA